MIPIPEQRNDVSIISSIMPREPRRNRQRVSREPDFVVRGCGFESRMIERTR